MHSVGNMEDDPKALADRMSADQAKQQKIDEAEAAYEKERRRRYEAWKLRNPHLSHIKYEDWSG